MLFTKALRTKATEVWDAHNSINVQGAATRTRMFFSLSLESNGDVEVALMVDRALRDLESRDARGHVEVLTAALALPALNAAKNMGENVGVRHGSCSSSSCSASPPASAPSSTPHTRNCQCLCAGKEFVSRSGRFFVDAQVPTVTTPRSVHCCNHCALQQELCPHRHSRLQPNFASLVVDTAAFSTGMCSCLLIA